MDQLLEIVNRHGLSASSEVSWRGWDLTLSSFHLVVLEPDGQGTIGVILNEDHFVFPDGSGILASVELSSRDEALQLRLLDQVLGEFVRKMKSRG